MRTIHSPSDPLPSPPFAVGGRVLAADAGVLVLGDAFATMRVRGAAQIGDLVIARITGADGEIFVADVDVVARDQRTDRGSGGEVARLVSRGAHLRMRAVLLAATRAFFVERGYLEVETPIAVPSPGLDVHLDAVEISSTRDGARYLITSPEYQMKRLLAGGMPRIFQLARCFRRGELGARHNPEFTMLEWYRAWSDVDAMIDETEALVISLARAARGAAELVVEGRTIALTPPFERLPLATAFARHAAMREDDAIALASDDEERFFRVLVDEVEPALAAGPPVMLVEWPASQASLARKKASDPRVAERFELMIGGVELCNGFGELTDPREQRARFEGDQRERAARGLPVYPIDERFLGALEEGLPPSSGNALGLDRLVALATGATRIGDVMTFPEGWL